MVIEKLNNKLKIYNNVLKMLEISTVNFVCHHLNFSRKLILEVDFCD